MSSWIRLAGVGFALAAGAAMADEDSAIKACEKELRKEYDVEKFKDVWADKEGHHKWRVYGKVKVHDHKYPFNCKIKDGEVKSYAFEGPEPKHGEDSDVGAAVAVGAGLAIVALALASDDGGSGGSDLASRMTHLEDDCHDQLLYRVRDEHDRSAEVKMMSAKLDGKDLTGEAKVKYDGHKSHHATYVCHFNKHGHLVDSSYKLY